MRAFILGFVFSMACGIPAALAQTANFPGFEELGNIRRISAEEAVVDPVQPESVVAPQASPLPFEGAVSVSEMATASSGGGSIYSEFCKCCEGCDIGGWRDNTEVWAGVDTFRSRGDGITILGPISPPLGNSFGAVAGFNTAVGLGDSPIRAQFGASYALYDWKGRWFPISDASAEQQTFITIGLSKRSNIACGDPISWGVVFDQMFDHQWGFFADELYLTQFRFIGGYALNECNEVGFTGTIHTQSDVVQDLSFLFPGIFSQVRAMNQANLFWKHNWEFGGTTTAYVGVLDSADVGDWLFGVQGTSPLNDYVSLYGGFTYVAPASGSGIFGSSLEQWNASLGLVYSFGGKAVSRNVSGPQGMPLLPVANNGNFLVTD